MNFLNKDTLIEVASIGTGVVAGNFVANKVSGYIPDSIKTPLGKYAGVLNGAIPVIGGLLLPSVAGKSPIVRGIANGMIASGGAKIVDTLLESFGVDTTDTKTIGEVMLNGCGYGEISDSTMMSGGNTMLSGTTDGGAYDSYSDSSYDTSYASSGEMDF
jgi:hypothetical protein